MGSQAARPLMLQGLQEAMHASSTRPTRDAIWNTLSRICDGWGLGSPLPLTVTKVLAIGATLRAGGGGIKAIIVTLAELVLKRNGRTPVNSPWRSIGP